MTIKNDPRPGPSYQRPERDCYAEFMAERSMERFIDAFIPVLLIIAGCSGLMLCCVNFWRWVS